MSAGEVNTAGAKFTFTITGEDYEQVITLPAEGTTKLVGLKPGKYTIKEADSGKAYAAQNYKYKETSYQAGEEAVQGLEGEVVVSKNNTTKVIFTNSYEPVGSLEVLKVDSKDDNTVLEGATFTLTGEDGNVKTAKSDKNGVVQFVELQYGEYTLKEMNAPAGYLLPEENEWTVTIDNKDQPVAMKIENIKENPSLKVDKTTDKEEYKNGEIIHYTIKITNDGNVEMEGITLEDVFSKNDDSSIDQLTVEGYEGAFNLAVGKSVEFTATYKIPETDKGGTTYINAVTVSVGDKVYDEDEVTVPVAKEPHLDVEKTTDKEEYKNRETVHYTITVTNDGNVDMKDITLDGVFSKDGNSDIDQLTAEGYDGPFDLAVGDTRVFDVYFKIPAADKGGTTYTNVVTLEVGDMTFEDDVTVTVEDDPSLKVEKTADKTHYEQGDTVNYTIKVTNDGNVDLTGLTLEDVFTKDEKIVDLSVEDYDGSEFNLAVGETKEFHATYVIPESDLGDTAYTNTATVKDGDTGVTAGDEVTIIVDPTYGFEINKTADKDEVEVGETITYTIDVTNTGNKALTDVKVIDEMVGLDETISQLDVGETKTLTVTHEATSDDIGELTNLAVAKVTIDGEEIVEEATATVIVTDVLGVAVEMEEPTTPEKVMATVKDIVNPKTGDDGLNLFLALVMFMFAGIGLYYTRAKK
nr:SpaA isopeptide-forming pilin-related protein [Pradoshia eiseniae]